MNGTAYVILTLLLIGIAGSAIWAATICVIRFIQKRREIAEEDRLKKPAGWLGLVAGICLLMLFIVAVVIQTDEKTAKTDAAITSQLTRDGFKVLVINHHNFTDDKVTVSKGNTTYYCSVIQTDKWRLVGCERTLN